MHYNRPPLAGHGKLEIKAVISFYEFMISLGEARVRLLQQYGVDPVDILLDVIRYKQSHLFPVPKEWFENYADVTGIQSLWDAMYGNPASTVTKEVLVKIYVDALFFMYEATFLQLRSILEAHGIDGAEPPNHFEALRHQYAGDSVGLHLLVTPLGI